MAKAKTKKVPWNLSFSCDKDGEIVHVNKVVATVKCPTCGLTLHWNGTRRELGAHGKTEKTLGHKLRMAQET